MIKRIVGVLELDLEAGTFTFYDSNGTKVICGRRDGSPDSGAPQPDLKIVPNKIRYI